MDALRHERKTINEILNDTKSYDLDQRRMVGAYKAEKVVPTLHFLQTIFQNLKCKVKEESDAVRLAKKELKAAVSEFRKGGHGDSIWDDIERTCFSAKGVKVAAYHGGSLEGNSIRKLMERADEIVAEMQRLLLEEFGNDEKKRSVIEERFKLHCETLLLLDGFFSHLRLMPTEYSVELADTADKFREASLDAWRRLGLTVTLKAHVAEYHMVDEMRLQLGFGAFTEDFIEQEHQAGLRDALRTRGMRSIERKAASMLKFAATSSRKDVRQELENSKQNRKRKFQGERAAAGSRAHNQRVEKRANTLANYTLGRPPLGKVVDILAS